MSEKKKNGWEMQIIFCVFVVMCIATLIDIIPSISASIWATRLYGIVCLAGVIYCARNAGQFMFIDVFLLMYPKNVQKLLSLICRILSLLCLAVMEIGVILSFMNYIGTPHTTVAEIYDGVLYAASIITYPIAFLYMLAPAASAKKEEK